jgi:3-(3-hydroxy-phenyl)propionate hydroxylase
MALRIGRFMQPKSRLGAMAMQGALRIAGLYPPARDYVLQLKFKPKPRFSNGYFVPGGAAKGVRAGQLFPQPVVELRDGTRVLLDELLGPGMACIGWASDGSVGHLASALGELAPRMVALLRRGEAAGGHSDTDGVTVVDCDGVLEQTLHEAGATAVLLRPDRYVLGYISAADPSGDMRRLESLLHGREDRPLPA